MNPIKDEDPITVLSGVEIDLCLPPAANPSPWFTVKRDQIYHNLSEETINYNNLELDSDITKHYPDGGNEVISTNRYKFITNDSFRNANEINNYLRLWGKIPAFLEVRLTPSQGYGIFTTRDIIPDTPLGEYSGIPRMTCEGIHQYGIYVCCINNLQGEDDGFIDGDNITFSNFTRFINHSKKNNCHVVLHRGFNYIYSLDHIPIDTELTINYGSPYWKDLARFSNGEIKEDNGENDETKVSERTIPISPVSPILQIGKRESTDDEDSLTDLSSDDELKTIVAAVATKSKSYNESGSPTNLSLVKNEPCDDLEYSPVRDSSPSPVITPNPQ